MGKRLQPLVDDVTAAKLQSEADQQSRKISPHAAHILKEHAKTLPMPKQESDPHKGEKREYDK